MLRSAADAHHRPRVLQVYPMLHPAGEELLRSCVDLRTASGPTRETVIAEGVGSTALIARSPARLGAEVFDALPELALVSATGSGADCFDVVAASERGIPVLHNPGVAPGPVAEHVVAAILVLLKRLTEADRFLRAGGGFEPRDRFIGREAAGRTLGLVGFGHIARDVARRARAGLDMDVVACSPTTSQAVYDACEVRRLPDLDALLGAADVVSVHVPRTSATVGMIGRAELARMRTGAVLVNTSRGGIVDEAALVDALRTERLAGAAVDVFAEEPPPVDHPLLGLPNVLVTPHIAGLTDDAARRLSEAIARNVIAALGGERPPNLVNPDVWPPRRPLAP